jgi:hypothetical protein
MVIEDGAAQELELFMFGGIAVNSQRDKLDTVLKILYLITQFGRQDAVDLAAG